jgi:hypothetical protein
LLEKPILRKFVGIERGLPITTPLDEIADGNASNPTLALAELLDRLGFALSNALGAESQLLSNGL